MADPRVHVVQGGEHLSQIAARYGFNHWDAIWDDPANEELKNRRKNPNHLARGDLLTIPIREQHWESVATEELHTFKVEPVKVYLRLQLLEPPDKEGKREPIADTDFSLHIPGEREPREGTTGSKGEIEMEIPRHTLQAELVVHTEFPKSFPLAIGELDPIGEETEENPDGSSISGVQQRLNNLGFNCGEVTGKMNDLTRGAIRSFRKEHDLAEGDQCNDELRNKLQEEHDNLT